MNRKKELKVLIDNAYLKEKELAYYQGDSLSLEFYDKTKSDLMKSSGFFHTPTVVKAGVAKILIEPEFFYETINNNELVFKEIEHIIFQSTRKINYMKSILGVLFTIWVSWYVLIHIYPFVLANLPFWLQVIGMIVLTVFLYGPITYLIIRVGVRDRSYGKQLSYFYNRITNKTFLKDFRRLKKSKRSSFFQIDIIRLRFKALQNATVRSFMPLVFLIGFFVVSITPYIIYSNDTPLGLFRQLGAVITSDSSIPSVVSTPYKYLDSIDNPTGESLKICGEYWCGTNNIISNNFYDKDFEPLTFPELCPNDELCHALWVEPYILIGYITEEEDEYYIWDPVTKSTIQSFNSIDMGISTISNLLVTSITYDSKDDSFYLVSHTRVDDASISFLSRYNSNGDWTNVELTNIYYSLIVDDEIYALYSHVTDTPAYIDVYDLLLNKKETIEVDNSYYSPRLILNQGEVFLGTSKILSETIFQLDQENKFQKVWSQSNLVGWVEFNNEAIVTNSTTMKSFRQFDINFNTISKGLFCSECEVTDYFDYYSYLIEDNILYAINSDKIYTFEYTSTIQRSISPSTVIPTAGYIIIALVIVINSFIVIAIKSNQHIIETIDTISSENHII